MARSTAETVFTVFVLSLVAVLLIGNVLGHPVLLGFVETGSMSPTLEAGDGFFAVPSILTDEPEVGDVVVFEAEEVQGGGLTTHRVVGETEDGYITKGDANPFTDQDGGEPPVTEDRIIADVLQVGGNVVAVPALGGGIEAVRGAVVGVLVAVGVGPSETGVAGPVLLLAGFALILISFLDERRASSRNRNRTTSSGGIDARVFVLLMLLAVIVPANAVMLGPTGENEIGTPDTEVGGEGELTGEITARNEGLVAMLVVLEPSDGVSLSQNDVELPSGEEKVVTVTPHSGTEPPYTVTEHRYFLLLPSSVLLSLHSVSPLFALGAVNLLLVVGVFGLVAGLVGTGRVRARDTKGGVPLATRVRRRLR
jgi:signal peptidase